MAILVAFTNPTIDFVSLLDAICTRVKKALVPSNLGDQLGHGS
jgi:hypothetical protein